MANRKLQKDIDIIFKKIQEGLHDFNYHYDRYESINTDEDSDNQREKEKLENDLKKEIKRLQKFREQIKIWQSNDVIKSMALTSNALSNKLMENKKLIEEAMEMYKDVERSSKLKTFSNQSILMASMDQQNAFDDEDYSGDDSDNDLNDDNMDFESGDDEEGEDYDNLSPEAAEIVKFLLDSLSQLKESTKKLNSEFEKLAHKKLRKNNLNTIEAKKEKIKTAKDANKFHSKKICKIVKLIKANKIPDLNLVTIIMEDLESYLATSTDKKEADKNLYDDIFNSISFEENYDFNDSEITETSAQAKTSATSPVRTDTTTPAVHANGSSNTDTQNKNKASIPASPINRKSASPEMASPAIIKILKPASTPSKPVGGLKWSAAAAVGLPSNSVSNNTTPPASSASTAATSEMPSDIPGPESAPTAETSDQTSAEVPVSSGNNEWKEKQIPRNVDDANSKFVDVLRNSSLSKTEFNLFSDMNLYKLPPGIQDLILSYTAKRNNSENMCLLYDSSSYNQYSTPIFKPYLPPQIQSCPGNKVDSFKIPLQYPKLLPYWNKIRANDQFEQLASEIEALQEEQNQAQHKQPTQEEIINELTSVFFFGYYHALTPVENLIAESYLFRLGWKPYQIRTGVQNDIGSFRLNKSPKNRNYLYWFRCIQPTSASSKESRGPGFGDYQVFDLSVWDFFVKIGFNFEQDLSQAEPSKVLC